MDERQADKVVEHLKGIQDTMERTTKEIGYIGWVLVAIVLAILAIAVGKHF